jgi:hypothetical protein
MIDNSIANAGKMGWGYENETIEATYTQEQREKEKLPSELIVRQEAKPVKNEVFLKKIKDLQAKDGIEDGICLRYLEEAAFGGFLVWLRQLIGSCVASGASRIVTRRTLADILIYGDMEELFGRVLTGPKNICPFAPFSYRAGRKLGNMNSYSDGSYCSVHIRGLMEVGMLPCSTENLTSDAFPEPQSESLYRSWGSSNGDTLSRPFLQTAANFKLLESEQVTDPDTSKLLIVDQMKGQMICSDWAFRPDYAHPTWKDRNGNPIWIYKRDTSTSWGHNMSVVGYVFAANKWWVIIENSWGMQAHKNGSFFIIPLELHGDWLKARYAESRSIGNISLTSSVTPVGW